MSNQIIKIACFGDICGEAGRTGLINYLSTHRQLFDFIIANGENSAHGFGITQKICNQLFNSGIDVITLGNHTFDQSYDLQMFDRNNNLIRPLNYPKGTPGHGYTLVDLPTIGKKIMVINLIGRLFMEYNNDPFFTIDEFLNIHRLGITADAILIDMHAEASSEKMALAHYLDGRVSGIFGTHTHVPTADIQILPNGTGFISDCGMCGDYNSVIGMEATVAIERLTNKLSAHTKLSPAIDMNSTCICGAVFEINRYGKCVDVHTIRVGGSFLKEQHDYIF